MVLKLLVITILLVGSARGHSRRKSLQKKVFYKSDESGSIHSPNYPGSYPNNREYTYNIELRENQRVELIFRRIDLEEKGKTSLCEDKIEIYDGFTSWSSRLYKICGDGSGFLNKAIVSKNHKLKVKFVSDGVDGNNKGFNASYGVYRTPVVTNMTQKVTGVVIGTACGLVFLALTFLAICHSRRLTLLYFFRRHNDIQSLYGQDAVQDDGPPDYDVVMNAPEKYPVIQTSKRKKERYIEIPENEENPPPYSALVFRAGPGEDVQSSADERETPRDFESIELLRDIGANDVTGSREPRDSENNVMRENDVRSGGDIAGSELRKGSHLKDDEGKKMDIKSDVSGSSRRGSDVRGSEVREIDVKNEAGSGRGECKSGLPRNELTSTNKYDVRSGKGKGEDGRETIIRQMSTNEITTDV